jgi:LTXXQ motif family protein
MSDRKKIWGIGGVVLGLLGLAWAAGSLAGCGPQRPEGRDDYSRWHYGYRHGGFGAPGFKAHLEKHLDQTVAKLNLSESQEKQYSELKRELEARLENGFEKRKQMKKAVEMEISKPNPDLNAVAALLKGKLNEFPAVMDGYVDLFMSFYNMLDREQQEKVIGEIREKLAMHHSRF